MAIYWHLQVPVALERAAVDVAAFAVFAAADYSYDTAGGLIDWGLYAN